ncbi:MAG: hypothetical protein AB7J32_09130 [Pseudonocardia sp.]
MSALRPVERACYGVAALLVASGVAHLGVQALLGGPWEGPVSWRKPVTFGLSFGITLASVAWAASYLQIHERLRTGLLAVLTVASVTEVALVDLQAWRGVPSHFNLETPFDATVARGLAAGGGVLIAVLTTLFVLSLRPQPGLDRPTTVAVRVGFATLVGSLAAGAVMIAVGIMLVNAGDPQAAYARGGFLKLTHFAAMHGIAILPILARLAAPLPSPWPPVRAGIAGYLTAVLASLVAPVNIAAAALVAAAGVAVLAASFAVAASARARQARGRAPAEQG